MKKRTQSAKDRKTESLLVYTRAFKSNRERLIGYRMVNDWFVAVLNSNPNPDRYSRSVNPQRKKRNGTRNQKNQ